MYQALAFALVRDLTKHSPSSEIPLLMSFLQLVQKMQDYEFGQFIGHDG